MSRGAFLVGTLNVSCEPRENRVSPTETSVGHLMGVTVSSVLSRGPEGLQSQKHTRAQGIDWGVEVGGTGWGLGGVWRGSKAME